MIVIRSASFALLAIPFAVLLGCSGSQTTDPAALRGNKADVRSSVGGTVFLTVDGGDLRQVIDGFGSNQLTLVYEGVGDVVPPAFRAEAVQLVYGEAGITLGNMDGAVLESPGGWNSRGNDNNDPLDLDWSGFDTASSQAFQEHVISAAEPLGFTGYYPSPKINLQWISPWLASIRSSDYDLYLDEAAEQVLAGLLDFQNRYGRVPDRLLLFNEPLAGNDELAGGTVQEVVDLVKRTGQRLRDEGFPDVRFIVPNEVSETTSLATATAILGDPVARQYVGVIGYHPYPVNSTYASVQNILDTSGQGTPDPARISTRGLLRDLARSYGVGLWMSEVSGSGLGMDPLSMDDLRGRAIHIHDEFLYAEANAYFGMNNMWDTGSHGLHFGNHDIYSQEGTLVLIDTEQGVVNMTGMGHAIAHYSRWVKPGSRRLGSSSGDPLVQISAFRSDDRVVVVLINNKTQPVPVEVGLQEMGLLGSVEGIQSTAGGYRVPLTGITAKPTTIELTLPAESVTTLTRPVRRAGSEPQGKRVDLPEAGLQ